MVKQEIGIALGRARRELHLLLSDPHFVRGVYSRYVQGQKTYGHLYEWLDWSDERFREEIATEVADFVIYNAMRSVVRGLQ